MRSLLVTLVFLLLLPALAHGQAGDAALQFADGLYREGMYELAAQEYRKILDRDADHAQAAQIGLRLGDALLRIDRYAEAARALKPVVDRGPSFPGYLDAAYRLGRALIESGDAPGAVRVLRRAERTLEQAGASEEIERSLHYWLAEAFYRSDQDEKALAALERLLESPREDDLTHGARYTAGWAAYRTGKPERALVHLGAFLAGRVEPEAEAECRYVLGECLFQLERFAEARQQYERAVGFDGPYRDDALFALAWCDFEQGQHAKALRSFARLTKEFPQSELLPRAALQAGIAAHLAGRPKDASRHLESVQGDDAVGAEATYWLAMIDKDAGELESAARRLEGIGTEDADLLERVHVAAGETLFRLGRHEEALARFAKIGAGARPEARAYALHASAMCHQALGDHEAAVEFETRHRQEHAQSAYRPAGLLVEGESLYTLERFEPAARAFATLLEEHPDHPGGDGALYKLGWCLTELERHEDARKAFLQVASRYPESEFAPESRKLAAEALAKSGREADAIRELERVAGTDPKVAHEARLEKARLERDREDYAAAVDSYAAAAGSATDPALRARARYEQAEVLYTVGELVPAIEAYRAALEHAADAPLRRAARYGLAWVLYESDQPDEAVREARSLLEEGELDPEIHASTLHLLGAAHQRQRRFAEAARAFEKLLAEHSDSPLVYEAMFGLGVAEAGAGEHRDAIRTFENALRRFPRGESNDNILYELAFAYGDAGKAAEWLSTFRRLAGSHPDSPLAAEALFRVAEHHYESEEFDEASKLYARATRLGSGPYLDKALYKKGWAERRSADHGAAAEAFGQLAESCLESPLRGEALYLRGESLREGGDAAEAEKAYRALLSDYGDHDLAKDAHLGLCLALVDQGAWDPAVRELEEHRRRYPGSERMFEVDFSLGRSLQALERYPSAVQAFRRVTASHRGETAARAQFEIGECMRAQGDHEAALSEYLKVRFLYAHEEWVAGSLFRTGECFERLEQPNRAEATFTELREKFPDSPWTRRVTARDAGSGTRRGF